METEDKRREKRNIVRKREDEGKEKRRKKTLREEGRR